MKIQNTVILSIGVLVVVGALVWLTLPGSAPEVSETPTISSEPSGSPSATPSTTFIGLTGLTEPASCSVGGSITFVEPNLSRNDDVSVSWKNVDIKGRHIDWTVTPNDNLAVGPNFFEALPLPNGSSTVTVNLPASPKAKQYTLRASVTYGQMVNGDVEVKSSPCTGEVRVTVGF